MEREKISVIIPTYNRARTLNRAIESVLKQTYNNIEIIIVDDCSQDNTESVIKKWRDKKIIYYKLDKNSGACVARNKGIELATGDYIAFQDSDDEWFPEKLSKQMKTLKESNTDIIFCAFNFVNMSGKIEKRIPDFDVSKVENITSELLKENFISTQTILGKKEVFRDIKFDITLPRFQDWDLAIRISKKHKISYIDEVLVNLYIQKDSITMNNKKAYESFKILYKKYKNEIESNLEIKYKFKRQIAIALFNIGEDCKKELKECLEIKFDIKVFIYYISCLLGLSKLILKLKRRVKNGIKNV